ncbi:serine hydrolase [Candidatus Peribacteria bacterium]|nr:MAG: serine hydrolase [Candidatus Peribacteria bacterium]
MYGPLLSVLLMGMVPVWGLQASVRPLTRELSVAPPALSADARIALQTIGQSLSASGVIITDLESGQVLFERNADISRPMASLTKLMTALIIVENHPLDTLVKVPMDILKTAGNDYEHLPPGDTFTVGDLLSAMLINSSNDAAVTLAKFHSGTIADFATVMNDRAASLGLLHTSYENPIGFDAPLQDSTPQDLAWLAMYVLRYPDIRARMGIAQTQIKSISGFSMILSHTHELLHEDRFIIAGKTGTTDEAGQCLLSIVEVEGRRYVVVLLHSRDRYADMRSVLSGLRSVIASQ